MSNRRTLAVEKCVTTNLDNGKRHCQHDPGLANRSWPRESCGSEDTALIAASNPRHEVDPAPSRRPGRRIGGGRLGKHHPNPRVHLVSRKTVAAPESCSPRTTAMNRFSDLLGIVQSTGLLTNLTPVDAAHVDQVLKLYPGLPEDYVDFLRVVGYGSFGDGGYSIYNGLVSPDAIFDATTSKALGDLLIFGDDFQGHHSAFQPQNGWSVVEIDSASLIVIPGNQSFEKFVRNKVVGLAI